MSDLILTLTIPNCSSTVDQEMTLFYLAVDPLAQFSEIVAFLSQQILMNL